MKAILSGPPGRVTHAVWGDQLCVATTIDDGPHPLLLVDDDPDDDVPGTVMQRSLVEAWFTLRTVAVADGRAVEVVGADGDDLLVTALPWYDEKSWSVRRPVAEFESLSQMRVDHLSFLGDPAPVNSLSLLWGPSPAPPNVDAIVDAITVELASTAPQGWRRINVACDAVAGWQILTTTVITADGDEVHWLPSGVVSQWFQRLRAAGHNFPFGTWFTARYTVEPGELPTLAFDTKAEPAWQPYFPSFADFAHLAEVKYEPTFYPRFSTHVPQWLAVALGFNRLFMPRVKLSTDVPERPELLLARAVDGMADGLALTYRTPVIANEKIWLLKYLREAPVVLSSRGFAPDAVDPEHPETVPMVFHTDGRWVWSGSVAHYLEHHDIAPDTAFLAHIRGQNHRVPERLPSAVRARALAVATGAPEEEPGLKEEFEQAASAVLGVAAHLGLDPAAYSLGAVSDGALCLVREGDRYVVFWLQGDERRFYAEFDSPGDAATYLIGFCYAYAGSLQRT